MISCRRKKYLLSEDMNIIRYLINEHAADEVRGNEIWKKMELLKVYYNNNKNNNNSHKY